MLIDLTDEERTALIGLLAGSRSAAAAHPREAQGRQGKTWGEGELSSRGAITPGEIAGKLR